MPGPARSSRLRPTAVAVAMAGTLLLTGCVSQDQDVNRAPGSAISAAEADVLADVLHQNLEQGGSTVTVTAAFAEGALLSMTGTVDFVAETGTVESLTTYPGSDQPDETRILYFTRDRMIVGGIPGLTDAVAAAGREDAQYVRTDLSPASRLIDNIASTMLNLRAEAADDPDNLIAAGTTWQGAAAIDGVLTNTLRTASSTVSVGVEDRLLHQYVTVPANNDFEVVITLTDHGEQEVSLPPEEQIVDASAYPEIAAQFGL